MKKVFIALAVIVVIIVIAISLVFWLTTGITSVAEEFFIAARDGKLTDAYENNLSEEFRRATSLEELNLFLQNSGLNEYEDASWDSRSIENEQGSLEGTIRTKSGGTVPVWISLVKEQGGWRIHTIEKVKAGAVETRSILEIPSEEILHRMINASMHDLALAINSRDFSAFHGIIAREWQGEVAPEELLEAFKSFSDQNIDLTVLSGFDPIFDVAPVITETDVLALQGHYETQPSIVHFDLGYRLEYESWKLLGIDVEIK